MFSVDKLVEYLNHKIQAFVNPIDNEKLYQFILDKILPALQVKDVKLFMEFQKNTVDAGDGIPVSGFFDSGNEPSLWVAVGTLEPHVWFPTMLHEFCHFEQWKEQCKVWTEADDNSSSILSDWVTGDYSSGEQAASYATRKMMAIELDCEKRTTQHLKLFPGLIDRQIYIQKANSYVASYWQYYTMREWNMPGKAAYLVPEIWTKMPTVFMAESDYWGDGGCVYKFDNFDWDLCFKKN